MKTKDIVQKLGYEQISIDTDSIFIKNSSGIATTDQYETIVSILRKETGLPISIEHANSGGITTRKRKRCQRRNDLTQT
jgi:pyruvate/oxaloacetate carboxyltransferase